MGISPPHFLNMLNLCVDDEADYYLSIGDPLKPMLLSGGPSDVQIEAAINPGYLQ